ncbi:MAG: 7-cyano-7-deazaguanine synthase [Hyphomicrobium sp.]|nr:7-cyano-7-deazaguanine synthase [Hyphomicrobium sp.]
MKTAAPNPERYGLALRIVEAGRRDHFAHADSEAVAEIGEEIVFDPDILDTYHYEGWKPVHHDLLLVSAAVEYADRRTARRIGRWARDFSITVPVIEFATWQRPEVQASLRGALRHLTGDDWQFSFVPWQGQNVLGARQRSLPFGTDRKFVIAYSDGLDSRCVSEVCGDGKAAVCVRVTKHRHSLKKGDQPFDQIPFRVDVPSSRESSVRSRGFKFAVITAIAGHLTGLSRIVVPESGQGALGPVLLPLHNVYPDYRNHPTYFRKIERFIKEVLGHDLRYDQPRLWNTKGETVSEFRRATNKAVDELFETRSCWQQRWNAKMDGKLRQCGLCAACLLRRMSMHAAGIDEPRNTYVIDDLTVSAFSDALPGRKKVRLSRTMAEYGSVGARHLQQLADMADLPDADLKVYAFEIARATMETQENVLKKIRNMLLTHAKEWRAFMAAQGEHSFLRNWTKGGRHGRSE